MEGHIEIYGEITSQQGDDALSYGYVNPRSVLDQIKANEGADTLKVHINSPGGEVDAGFAIYDILKSTGKKIITQVEGQCYSIATVPLMAGKQRLATPNSQFLIHFPMSEAMGNADDIEKVAKQLRKLEKKAAKFYSANANISQRDAMAEMEKNDFMDLEKAMEYGFLTGITDTNKAVAKFKTKDTVMSDEKGFWAKFKNEVKAAFDDAEPKNLTLKTSIGEDLVFQRESGEVQKGDEALLNGENATGEILMANGDTLVFEGGKLEDIKEKEAEKKVDIATMVVDAVQKAIEPLNEKITAIEAQNTKFGAEMVKREKVFNSLKGIVSENTQDQAENKDKNTDAVKNKPINVLSPIKMN